MGSPSLRRLLMVSWARLGSTLCGCWLSWQESPFISIVPDNSKVFRKSRDSDRTSEGPVERAPGTAPRRGRLRLGPARGIYRTTALARSRSVAGSTARLEEGGGGAGPGEAFLGRPVGGSQSVQDAPGSFQVWEAFGRSGWQDPAEAGAHGPPGIAARGLGLLSAR